ncbi:MAG TPA: hypothetical protein DIU07_12885 [Rhodobacteraceae bacterium]|nr:hypothetical protein [Paracoccaceae bacterium]
MRPRVGATARFHGGFHFPVFVRGGLVRATGGAVCLGACADIRRPRDQDHISPPGDTAPPSVLREALAGLVVGFDNFGRAIALVTLIFTGGLAAGTALATSVFLLAGAVGTLSLILRRDFVGPVFSSVQNAPVAILMPVILAVAAMPGSDSERVATVFAVLGGTAVLTGIAMIAVAQFNLGRIVRLMPFPVAAGYLAASGALLIVSAADLVCAGPGWLGSALQSGGAGLLPAGLTLGLAALLGLVSTRWRGFGLVATLIVALGGFFAALAVFGLSLDDVRALGLLPAMTGPQTAIAVPFLPLSLADIQLGVLWDAGPLIGTVALIGMFSTLLNVTGAELAVRRDIDTRGELLRCGGVNVATGLFGGTVSFISASNTTSAVLLGAHGRLPGMIAIAGLTVAAVFSGRILPFVPPFASAALLIFFGGSILWRWLVATRRVQSPLEWLVTLAIVVASLSVGMVMAVALGIVLASLLFAVSYARLPMIRDATDLAVARSTVDRGPAQSRYLDAFGAEVALVRLQGFLFFGSIEQLTRKIRTLLEAPVPARQVILDFSRVSGMDASVLAALRKLDILAGSKGVFVVLAGMNPEISGEVTRAGLLDETLALSVVGDIETALEIAENALLDRMETSDATETVRSALEQLTGNREAAGHLFAAMAREEVAAGTVLVRAGDWSDDVFMLESGALSIYIAAANGADIRVRKQIPGSIVGEIAAYAGLPRTANVEADTDSVVYRMSEARLAEIRAHRPDLAAGWHRAMAAALAEKLDRTNKLLGQQIP